MKRNSSRSAYDRACFTSSSVLHVDRWRYRKSPSGCIAVHSKRYIHRFLIIVFLLILHAASAQSCPAIADQSELNDVHFHLTNYIQQGTDIHNFLNMMGTKVGRVALFGIPLQQDWSYQTLVTSLQHITCKAMRRSITTLLRMPISPWHTVHSPKSSRQDLTL